MPKDKSPPPSYEDVFGSQGLVAVIRDPNDNSQPQVQTPYKTEARDEDLRDPLAFLKRVDIVPAPLEREMVGGGGMRKYVVSDGETGSEVLFGMDVPSSTSDLRPLSLHLQNGKELIKAAYIYSPDFSTFEFSEPSGSPIGTFRKEGLAAGLCGCFCLCFCCPLATAAIKAPNGEPLALANSFLFPRKVEINKPEHLGGTTMGSILVQDMNSKGIVTTSFQDKLHFNDKILLIALSMSMMDYERVHGARGGNPFTLTDE